MPHIVKEFDAKVDCCKRKQKKSDIIFFLIGCSINIIEMRILMPKSVVKMERMKETHYSIEPSTRVKAFNGLSQTELLVFKWDKRRPHQAIRIDRIKDVFYPLFNALIFPYI